MAASTLPEPGTARSILLSQGLTYAADHL